MNIDEQFETEEFTTQPFSEIWWRDRMREAMTRRWAYEQKHDSTNAERYNKLSQWIKRRIGV